MINSNPAARGVSLLAAPHRPSDRVNTIYTRLEELAAAENLVLIPTGLDQAGGLPRVELGPDLTQLDVAEFVAMMVGFGQDFWSQR